MDRFSWCESFNYLRGQPISFAGRSYLRAIYNSTARRIVLRCSRQVEKTTFICNVVVHAAMTLPGIHIIVVFPRQDQASVFAKSRLRPIISESPVVRRVLQGNRSRDPQVNHMRFANGSEVYIRAAYHSADAVRGIDGDFLLVDEYQDIAGGDLPVLEEALSHSAHRRVFLTGTPKSIDNHLEDAFNRSTANEWRVPCPCGQQVLLDEKCLGPLGPICSACGKAIDPKRGAWLARNPSSTWGAGFTLNHLVTPWLNYTELLERQQSYNPALFRNECLGLGNGRLGGMVFGGVEEERIQFNVDSLWTGDENPSGDYRGPGMGFYKNFGNLYVDFDATSAATMYRRELNISRAVVRVVYEQDGTEFVRETFCSHPEQVLVSRLTANATGKYSGRIRLAGGREESISVKENRLTFAGTLPNGMEYEAQVLVVVEGGSVETDRDTLVFSRCDSLTMILAAGTDYAMDYTKNWRGEHPHGFVTEQANQAGKKAYPQLLTAHIEDHQSLYNRVVIDLGKTADAQLALPVDQRLQAIGEGKADPQMDALLFQYGRYLLIASSRPGSLPTNLQGLWNDRNNPPWHADYHSNINVQMNYWLAEPANLADCHEPLFDLLTASLEPFRKATRLAYGDTIRGFTIRTSHNPFGGMGWKWNIPASAWYAQHF